MTIGFAGLALGLIIGGLLICYLSSGAGNALLAKVFWVTGIVLAVIGFILLVTPVFVWASNQLRQMLGM